MKKLINVLVKKKSFSSPPVWFMRQAGRYLPEYRKIRANTNGFLELCYSPKLASEITIQPIKRFDFDAAIMFSDILVIPDALGVKVDFVKNEGPKLGNFKIKNLKIENLKNHLSPVFESIEITKSNLKNDKALIGFSGAPWTLACYMIEGGSSKDFKLTRQKAICDQKLFGELIEILTESVLQYAILQIEAGVDVVKLFDSWAGALPPEQLKRYVIDPAKKIISGIKKKYPKIPIICFPRGIGMNCEEFVKEVSPDCLAIDQTIEKKWAEENLQKKFGQVLQGNLDNFLLAFGSKKEIEKEVVEILKVFKNKPFIFNTGHGILPETPIENIELVMKIIRKN